MSNERITREKVVLTPRNKKKRACVCWCVLQKATSEEKKSLISSNLCNDKKIRKEKDSAPDLWGGSCVGVVVPEERSLGSSPVRGVDIFAAAVSRVRVCVKVVRRFFDSGFFFVSNYHSDKLVCVVFFIIIIFG